MEQGLEGTPALPIRGAPVTQSSFGNGGRAESKNPREPGAFWDVAERERKLFGASLEIRDFEHPFGHHKVALIITLA